MPFDMHDRRAEPVRRLLLALAVIVAFFAVHDVRLALWRWPAFAALYRTHAPQLPTVLWKATQLPLVLLVTMLLLPGGVHRALRSLGVDRGFVRGIGWTFVGTLPALMGFALLGRPHLALSWALVMTAVASPLSEELLFRGFFFRQLYERAHWPFWLATLANAVPFALGHLYQAREIGAGLLGAAGILLITAIGAAFSAWLFARWSWNLWPAIGFHAFMNLWAHVFGMGESVVSTPLAIPFMAAAVIGTIAVTVWRTGGWRVRRVTSATPPLVAPMPQVPQEAT